MAVAAMAVAAMVEGVDEAGAVGAIATEATDDRAHDPETTTDGRRDALQSTLR
jgi:hypothetical protein